MPRRPAGARRRLLIFAVTASTVALALWLAGPAVLPFALGLVFAYLVAPIVARVDGALRSALGGLEDRWPALSAVYRPAAILTVYAMAIGVVVAAILLLSVPLAREAADIRSNWPAYAQRAESLSEQALAWYEELGVSAEIEAEARNLLTRERLEQLGVRALELLRDGLMATFGTLASTVSFFVASLIVPFWLFYILHDTGRVMRAAVSLVPRDIRPDVEALRIIVDRVLSGYIRGQLIIALVLGVLVTSALFLVGMPYAVTLGVVAGALGIIPFVGAILGALPALFVALLQGPSMVLKVLLVFVAVQQIENLVVSPRVQSQSVSLNPGVIMVVTVLGQALFGFLGLIIAVPLTAALRDVIHYTYIRAGEQPVDAAGAMERVGYGTEVNRIVRGEDLAPIVD